MDKTQKQDDRIEELTKELQQFASDDSIPESAPFVVFVDDPFVSQAVHQAALKLNLLPAPYGPNAFSVSSDIPTTTMAAFTDLPTPYRAIDWKGQNPSASHEKTNLLSSVLSYINPIPLFRSSHPSSTENSPQLNSLNLVKDKELGLNPAHLSSFPSSISIWKGRCKDISEIKKCLKEFKVRDDKQGEVLRFPASDPLLRYATRVAARNIGLVGVAEGSGAQRRVSVWHGNDKNAMEEQLRAFASDPEAIRLTLPPMDPELRLEIALSAAALGLIPRSRGFGSERQLIIYPKIKLQALPEPKADLTRTTSAILQDEGKLRQLYDGLSKSPKDGSIRVAELVDTAMHFGLPEIFARDLMKELTAMSHAVEGESRLTISYEDFEKIVQSKEKSIRAAFDTLDPNGTGSIRFKELGIALEMGQLALTKEDEDLMKSLVERSKRQGEEGMTYSQFRDFVALLSPSTVRHSGEEFLEAVTKGYTHFSLKPSKKNAEKTTSAAFAVASATAGGIANAVSRTFVAPLERVRLQMSVDPTKYPNLISAIRGIYQAEGIQGLWRGNVLNVIRIAPQGAISFLCKDICRDALPSEIRNTKVGLALSSMASGAICMTAVYPLDMVRGQMTTSPGLYPSWWAGLKSIYKEGGIRGLFKGGTHSASWASAYYGVQFFSYDSLKKSYMNYWKQRGEVRTIDTITGLSLGAVSGALCVSAAYPLELVRRKLQVQGLGGRPIKYSNWFDCAKQVMTKEGGIRGFYKGLPANLVKTPPSIAITFGCYEWLLPKLHKMSSSFLPEDDKARK